MIGFPYIKRAHECGYSSLVLYAFGQSFIAELLGLDFALGVCEDMHRLLQPTNYLGLQPPLLSHNMEKELNKVRCLIGEQTLTLQLFEHINAMYRTGDKDE